MVEPIFQEMVDGKSPEDVCSTAVRVCVRVCARVGAWPWHRISLANGALSQVCNSTTPTPSVLLWLTALLSVRGVAEQPINVCSSTGAVSTVSKPEASIECQACEVIIMYAERLGNNATYEEIMTELQQVRASDCLRA